MAWHRFPPVSMSLSRFGRFLGASSSTADRAESRALESTSRFSPELWPLGPEDPFIAFHRCHFYGSLEGERGASNPSACHRVMPGLTVSNLDQSIRFDSFWPRALEGQAGAEHDRADQDQLVSLQDR